jgi:branched-chain amino acid transport system permease protein
MELARALAGRPRLLLLDETLAGLSRAEVEEMIELIRTLPKDGVTVMIIEHTMHAMVRLADRFLVLDHGRVLADGPPAVVTREQSVVEAYLGKKWAMASAGD